MSLVEMAEKTISRHKMLARGDNVVVSVSGGPDSMALLYTLVDLARDYEFQVHVWHLNHLIRVEAKEEANYVRGIADKLGLECTVEEMDVKKHSREHHLSVQESGREMRYEALEALRKKLGAHKIAIGHSADDSVETFFINLFRGTGPRGLRGIAPCNGKIIRPLIDCRRSEIIEYLQAKKIAFKVDQSNLETKYLRNRVRLELLPIAKEISPALGVHIKVMGEILDDEESCLSELTDQKWLEIVRVDNHEIGLDVEKMLEETRCFQRRLIRKAIEELAGQEHVLDFRSVESIIDNTLGKKMDVVLGGGYNSTRTEDDLVIYKSPTEVKPFQVDENGGLYEIDQRSISVTISAPEKIKIPPEKGTQLVDAGKIEWPIEIRAWKRGDWFIPLGMGGRKKLHDFFIDAKISRHLRSMVPIFCDRKKIVAVGDLRIDERVKISGKTKSVVVFTTKTL